MKILTVCDQGNNRSITLAHQIKYLGHDVLSAGTGTNSYATLQMLYDWAERIIVPDQITYTQVSHHAPGKTELWDIGPDIYKRPHNPELLAIVKRFIADKRATL